MLLVYRSSSSHQTPFPISEKQYQLQCKKESVEAIKAHRTEHCLQGDVFLNQDGSYDLLGQHCRDLQYVT